VAEGDPDGGSLALGELIDEHGAALVADFRSHFHVWLWDAIEELSPRILLALVGELPDNGSFAASVQGGREFQGWGIDRHMLANLYDATATAGGLTKKGAKTPVEHYRPGKKPKQGGVPFRALIGRDL
jgi:hypothetical protein